MRMDEYVSINNKIARSVNLERDATDIEQIREFQSRQLHSGCLADLQTSWKGSLCLPGRGPALTVAANRRFAIIFWHCVRIMPIPSVKQRLPV